MGKPARCLSQIKSTWSHFSRRGTETVIKTHSGVRAAVKALIRRLGSDIFDYTCKKHLANYRVRWRLLPSWNWQTLHHLLLTDWTLGTHTHTQKNLHLKVSCYLWFSRRSSSLPKSWKNKSVRETEVSHLKQYITRTFVHTVLF